jgi:hypothetical protein
LADITKLAQNGEGFGLRTMLDAELSIATTPFVGDHVRDELWKQLGCASGNSTSACPAANYRAIISKEPKAI